MNSAYNKFWTEFLEMYQYLPVLWDPNDENYNKMEVKAAAYDRLVDKLKEIDPEADRAKVKTKIHTFRTNYMRELRKIKKAGMYGEKIQSTLWFFELLHFLSSREVRRKTNNTTSDDYNVTNRSHEKVKKHEIVVVPFEKLKENRNATSVLSKNSSISRHADNVFWCEFLKMYKSLPVLWKVNSANYSKWVEKADAYDELMYKLKEIDPDATRAKVIKIINIFLTSYRRELKKKKAADKSNLVFKSTLWYFDLLYFLADQEIPRNMKRSVSEDDNMSNEANTSFVVEDWTDQEVYSKVKRSMSEDENVSIDGTTSFVAEGWTDQESDGFNNVYEPPLKQKRVTEMKIRKVPCKKLKGSTSIQRKSSTPRNDDNRFWCEFLDLYKSLPVLWKVKSENYGHPHTMAAAYDKLVKKLKEIDPEANKVKVRKKIHIFRTNYRRELRKLKNDERYVSGHIDVLQSNLWYFDRLNFLADQVTPRKVRNSASDDDTLSYDATTSMEAKCWTEQEEHIMVKKSLSDDESVNNDATTSIMEESWVNQNQHSKAKRTMIDDEYVSDMSNEMEEEEMLKMACKKLKENSDAPTVLAKGWASQYQELTNEQKVLSRTIWADVLFHGCMNRLTEKMVEDIHQVLKGTSHTATTKDRTPYYEEYSFAPQSQSTFVALQETNETLISFNKPQPQNHYSDPLLPRKKLFKDPHRLHQI